MASAGGIGDRCQVEVQTVFLTVDFQSGFTDWIVVGQSNFPDTFFDCRESGRIIDMRADRIDVRVGLRLCKNACGPEGYRMIS